MPEKDSFEMYREMYLTLLKASEEAIAAIDMQRPELAREILVAAEQAAEDLYE